MTTWPVNSEQARVYVAGAGLGTGRGRQPDGAWLVDFPNYDCIIACVPSIVFELRDSDHRPACAFAIEGGHA